MTEGWRGEIRPASKRGRKKKDPPQTAPDADPRPVIRVTAGNLPGALEEAEAALIEAGAGPIFQRAGQLVHIAERPARRSDESIEAQPAIVSIEPAALAFRLAEIAKFEKFDVRANDWRQIDPPARLIEAYFAKARWRLPDLRQITHGPTVRLDGSMLATPGYDARTGLYLADDLPALNVPDRPGPRQAEAAADTLADVFREFPYVEEPTPGLGLSVALAGVLGAVLRPTLPAAPLIGISAPAPGTGKSYLVDLISIIATGRRAVGIATGTKPEEFEKAFGAGLIEGRSLLCLDNMVQPLQGQLLAMTLTAPAVSVRILGHSRMVDAPTGAAIFATGNNLAVRGDMSRRVLLCRLDAGVEYPEDRTFDNDLLAEVQRRRPELLSAVLTILRWHHVSRDPAPRSERRFAGFEAWCARVRDPLIALGYVDPVKALDITRAADVEATRLRGLIEAWWRQYGDRSMTGADAINEADTETADALAACTGDRIGAINTRKLTNYLSRFEGRIVANCRFQRDGTLAKATRWKLMRIAQ